MMEKMRMESENYVYKKEIDWSTLMEGFTLPLDNQVIFLRNMENFLQRGQSKIIHFFMNGKTYDAFSIWQLFYIQMLFPLELYFNV